MLVSVIIPSFRQPQFLERAIRSCLEQDHDDLEVVVVEDRSRDASLGIAAACAARDPRVTVVDCPENGGLGRARNIGIAHASGDLLCFLDSDDYLLDRSISSRLDAWPRAVEEHGDQVVGVYGDWQHVAEAIDQPVVRAPRASMPLVSAANFTGENVFICSAPLVRREAVVDAGGFPEGLRMLEDFALWAKVISRGGVFVPVHHVVATYRQRPNSMLRGDGVVVMADHVEVINEWVERAGVPLADGGAMSAWLEDRDPRSFGRMSWSVPSILGNYGGGPDARAVFDGVQVGVETGDRQPLSDFMSEPRATGLEGPPETWDLRGAGTPELSVAVETLADSLAALGLVLTAEESDLHLGVRATDPTDWSEVWPLALARIAPAAHDDTESVALTMSELTDRERRTLIARGIESTWGAAPDRSGSYVFVPHRMLGHPALDAWLSVALHTLADGGHDPRVMADPRVRAHLAGARSEVTSIELLRAVDYVVAPQCRDLEWLSACAPTIVFDPMDPLGDCARTAAELELALRARRRKVSPVDAPDDDVVDEILARLQRREP